MRNMLWSHVRYKPVSLGSKQTGRPQTNDTDYMQKLTGMKINNGLMEMSQDQETWHELVTVNQQVSENEITTDRVEILLTVICGP